MPPAVRLALMAPFAGIDVLVKTLSPTGFPLNVKLVSVVAPPAFSLSTTYTGHTRCPGTSTEGTGATNGTTMEPVPAVFASSVTEPDDGAFEESPL